MLFGFHLRIAAALALIWLIASAEVSQVLALQPSTPVGRLGRQSWTMENGLPQNTVSVLLQSQDGFLWAGTELGLARFDGVNFRLFDHATTPGFPDAEINCMLDAGTDGLWIGTADGLVRWKDGIATLLTTHDGLQGNSIRGLAQSSNGALWIWTESGLTRWDGRHLQAVPAENGLPAGEITSIAADGADDLWIGSSRGTAVLRAGHWHPGPGSADLTRSNAASLVKALSGGDILIASRSGLFLEHLGAIAPILTSTALPAEDISFLDRLPDGAVVAATKSSVFLLPGKHLAGRPAASFCVSKDLPGSRIESMFADREDSLWIGTNRGLARISTSSDGGGPSIQLLPPTDPLSSNAIVSLLEDKEGDLWAGTETAGLHILRDTRFRVIGSSDGLSSDATTAVVQDSRKALWIGTRNEGLNRISGGMDGKLQAANLTTANGLSSNVILALASGLDGDLWVGTPDGLDHIARDGTHSYTSADGLPDDFIRSVLVAPGNSVWIGTRRGLTRLDHNHFENYTQADGLGSDLVGALARSADGDLWIATLNGLSRLHQGQLKNFSVADGLSSNVITALDFTPEGILWIGTQDHGLNAWDGSKFLNIDALARSVANPLPAAIHAVTHDDRGHLWLASDAGLTRVDLQPLLDCAQHAASFPCRLNTASVVNFTTADGLRSRETSSNSHPTACRSADGKLWFTSPRGVIVVDPLHFPANPAPPPVAIERFEVDDHEGQPGQRTRIASGALRFQFDYAGLSFASPQKLRYQYMLEGFDHRWTDAGSRRTAYYTNIPPGKYTFRVRAALAGSGFADANEPASASDAVSYTPREASLSFQLLPHYYQTAWFLALVILALVSLVLLVFRRRVLHVEREFRAVMAERNRIAREIHDTLAQGYVGISLQLEILGELLRHNRAEAAQKHLTLTQSLVREGLNDARQSIWALRSHDSAEQTLPIRLRRLVEQAADRNLAANLEVHGATRPLATQTEQEILRIAQEAIHNVKRHAAASRLSVRLDYGDRHLGLKVTDDGKGFDAENGTLLTTGHFGLTGMRERAALIAGQIQISSQPGKGTTLNLSLPIPELRTQPGLSVEPKAGIQHSDSSKEQV